MARQPYIWPARHVTPCSEIAGALRMWRREYVQIRDGLLPDKAMKQMASHYMKLQRACTLMLPWFGECDRGQQPIKPEMWPGDIAVELDEVSHRICWEFG